MTKTPPAALDRRQTRGEEIANAVSHGVGFLAAAAATPSLIARASGHPASFVVGVGVFAASVAFLYLGSSLIVIVWGLAVLGVRR